MRCAVLLFLTGCYASHAVGDDAGICGPTALAATWGPAIPVSDHCSVRYATVADRGISLCWHPCEGVDPSIRCQQASLSPWRTGPQVGPTLERSGVATFEVGVYDIDDLTQVHAMAGSDGSLHGEVRIEPDPETLTTRPCGGGVLALSPDAWALMVFSSVVPPSTVEDTHAEIHVGSFAEPLALQTAHVLMHHGWRNGAFDGSLLALARDDGVTIIDATGAMTDVPPHHPGDRVLGLDAFVDGRVLWYERDDTHGFVVQRRTDGSTEVFLDDPTTNLAEFGTDGPAYVWVTRTIDPSHRLAVYTAPIVEDPAALRPRRVNEGVTPGWTLVTAWNEIAHDHAHVAMVIGDPTTSGVLVLELASGRATELTLPASLPPYAVTITSAHEIVVAASDDMLLKVDLDTLPDFTP